MANIDVTTTDLNVNVSSTTSNIVVTDTDSNAVINVSITDNVVNVTNTPINVSVAIEAGISNLEIRAALSNSLPIIYDNVNGVIGFDASTTAIQIDSLSVNGNIDANGNININEQATITGNLNTLSNLNVTGNIYGGNLFLNNANIVNGDLSLGGSALSLTGANIVNGDLSLGGNVVANDITGTLKNFDVTYYDAGNVGGNVTLNLANGNVQKIRLINDLTGLTFTGISASTPITLIVEQDSVGFWEIDTTTYPGNWTNWEFVSNFKRLSTTPGDKDLLNITYDGTSYYASVVNFFQSLIVNSELANSNIIINGTTFELGSSGNINLSTTNVVARYLTVDSNISPSGGVPANVLGYTTAMYASPSTDGKALYVSGSTFFIQDNDAANMSFIIRATHGAGSVDPLAVFANTTISQTQIDGNLLVGAFSNTAMSTRIFSQGNIISNSNITGGNISANSNVIAGAFFLGNGSLLTGLNTSIVTEGANLYFSNARVNAFIQDNITTTDIDEGANLYYTTDRANTAIGAYTGNINTTGNISAGYFIGNGSLLTDISTLTNAQVVAHIATVPLTVGGNLIVNGNMEVQGNIDYVNVQDLQVVDNEIILNYGNASAREAFIYVDRSGSTLNNSYISWNETNDLWEFNDGANTYTLARSTTDLAEGANLYFSNARVNAFIQDNITTTDIDEGANLYFSNARVNAFIQDNITTTDIDEGANLYFSNARVNAFIQDNITTTDIDEGANLYFTAARANTAMDDYLVSITANVDSVNGQTGVVVLDTDDIQEGSNLYFSNARVNAFIQDNITTTDIDEGANQYYTTDRANTAIGNYQGDIDTPGNISAGNVITNVIQNTGTTDVTIHTDKRLILKHQFRNVSTFGGNILSSGYAVVGDRLIRDEGRGFVHNGANSLSGVVVTAGDYVNGSNVLSNVAVEWIANSNVANLDVIKPLFVYQAQFFTTSQFPFPQGTYVVSVDAGNSEIYMSANASLANVPGNIINSTFHPGARDTEIGTLVSFISEEDFGGAFSSNVLAATVIHTSSQYGYPETGWDPSYFTYATGTATDYAIGNNNNKNTLGKSSLEGNKMFLNSPLGLTIGERTDATQMGFDDQRYRFGLNILWDGLSNPNVMDTPGTGIMMRQYTDNSLAGTSALTRTTLGPSLIFTANEGNASMAFRDTYPRLHTELGKIGWVSTTSTTAIPAFGSPTAYISCVMGQDGLLRASGTGMYFVNSPNTGNTQRGVYLGNSKGNTLITGGSSSTSKVLIAPMVTTTSSNTVLMFDNNINNNRFAEFGFVSGTTGSEFAITNGGRVTTGTAGDLRLRLDRRTTGAGGTVNAKIWDISLAVSSNNLVVAVDTVTHTTFTDSGNLDVAGNISAQTVTANLVGTSATLTGDVSGANFIGNGAQLTNLVAGNVVFLPNSLFANTIVNVQAALDDLQINKLNVSALTSSVTFFATTANSNVAGYTKLVTTTGDPDYNTVAANVSTGAITTTGQLLANLISAPGVLIGNTTPINITTIGNIRKTVGGAGQNARFYFEVYKRTNANVETLIGTSDLTPEVTSATFEEFNDTALITDTNFTANDSVVLKYYGTNVGGGSPEYEFQFGGTAPVRTLFPVPVSVVPTNRSASFVEVDTTNFAGVLSGADDTVQKALDTIDNITTTSVPEGSNLYFSNARVNAFIQDSITTTDIDEGANLYFSNARVNAFIQDSITTTDIDEGSNLYFTSARANTAMDDYLVSITANVDSVNGLTGIVLLDTDTIPEGSNLYYSNTRVNAFIQSSITTTDITEGANLYFTTDRANTAMDDYLVSVTANVDSVNGQTGVVVLDTDDIAEGANLYFSNARVNAFIQDNITTTDIDEGANLYFSNARVNAFIQSDITTTDIDEGANLYFTTDRANTAMDLYLTSITANVDSVNGQTGVVVLDTDDVLEGSNLYFSNARVNAFIQDNITTTDIDEGANLYFTSARANTAMDDYLTSITANVDSVNGLTGIVVLDTDDVPEGANLYFSNARVNAFIQDNITTTDIDEGANLYFSNARVNAFIQDSITTTDIDEGSNLYFTSARANTAMDDYLVSITANVDSVNGLTGIVVLDTDDVLEGSNLYFSNARVNAFIQDNITTTDIDEGANLYFSNARVNAFIQDSITTTDIVEGANLYFSNARVNAFIQDSITTTDITEGANLYYTTDRANTAIGAYDGDINTTGNITGAYINGNGSQLTGFVSKTANVNSVNGQTGNVVLADANIQLKQFSETTVELGNVSGDISSNIDLSLGTIFTMTATGNITINSMANATNGVSATLIISQDGTGDRLLTSNLKYAGNVRTLSTAANVTDIISVIYAGNVYYAALTKGYE